MAAGPVVRAMTEHLDDDVRGLKQLVAPGNDLTPLDGLTRLGYVPDCLAQAPLAHLVERRTFNPVGRVRVPHGA